MASSITLKIDPTRLRADVERISARIREAAVAVVEQAEGDISTTATLLLGDYDALPLVRRVLDERTFTWTEEGP